MKKNASVVCLILIMSLFLCACSHSKYDKAISMMESGNYQKALEIFRTIRDYEDSAEKIEECEAALIEQKYTGAISLLEEGKSEEAKVIFEELGEYKDSSLYTISCDAKIAEKEYLEGKSLADAGRAEAYDKLKSFEKNYYEKVIWQYQVITDKNSTDESFIQMMEDKPGYDYYINIQKDIAAVLAKHPELAQVGDHYFYGAYEQDNNEENGKEPIEWVIVNKENDKLKLCALYVLDAQPYHAKMEKVGWQDCTLRTWLNGTFYNEAFSVDEQKKILVTKNEAYRVVKNWNGKDKRIDDTVDDYVFLDELNVSNGDEGLSSTTATPYAWARGLKESSGRFSYWMMQRLETHWGIYWAPGDYGMRIVKANGATVNDKGLGVRPFMWLEVKGVTAKPETEQNKEQNSDGTFTNKYGTATTKCAHSGCNNYIASSGDTNCCIAHSSKCLNCNCYIDEDAMYCMSCLSGSKSDKKTNSDKTSSKGCQYKYLDGSICGAKCTDYPSMCNKHMKELNDIYEDFTN